MSRIAKKPVVLPTNVQLSVTDSEIKVKGPKGELELKPHPFVKIDVQGNEAWFSPNLELAKRKADERKYNAMVGTYWRLVKNMVIGVTEGFKKELEIVGVGYRAQMQGNKLVMNLGYAHLVEMEVPADLTVEVPAPNRIVVSGIDKQKVGQYAADIKKWREPNSYSGKGIKYANEVLKLKEGKKA
ncbi:MAG TPA: 50S ribosomal protein L6 [Fervidobacterium sp.]|nr:50S ribosomal protein L6 [Fervidobacterium sp.]HPT53558.1 50S ribosomal protein L6 [Fervidobacterium sp.]HPZ16812.1 50S ribosomal protein L6 [Fervidobacterium sp.]HQE47824.1 50S ribosomal protein L6 [Fervidobacterium sp.]HUM41418.1 50S ribosomal protein L6 [Fervidobacterium sp.]